MGCGPHLYDHMEEGVLGVFNQKNVFISSLSASVGAVSAASCSGDTGGSQPPDQPGCPRPCRTRTLTAPFPPGHLG